MDSNERVTVPVADLMTEVSKRASAELMKNGKYPAMTPEALRAILAKLNQDSAPEKEEQRVPSPLGSNALQRFRDAFKKAQEKPVEEELLDEGAGLCLECFTGTLRYVSRKEACGDSCVECDSCHTRMRTHERNHQHRCYQKAVEAFEDDVGEEVAGNRLRIDEDRPVVFHSLANHEWQLPVLYCIPDHEVTTLRREVIAEENKSREQAARFIQPDQQCMEDTEGEGIMDLNQGFESMAGKMLGRMFKKVDNVVWDLATGKVGVRTKDGIMTLEGVGEDAQVVCNMFDSFGMPLPAFAQNTPINDIKEGDLIYKDSGAMGWVVKRPAKVGGKRFVLLRPDGTRGEWNPPKTQSLGLDLNGAMVLRSLVNLTGDGKLGGLQGGIMNIVMMSQMMGGDSDSMLDKMLPFMLFSQMNGGADAATAGMGGMMGGGMMQMMLMSQMMGGKGSTGSCGCKPGTTVKRPSFFDDKG